MLHPYTTVTYFSQRTWTATTFLVNRTMFITGDLAFLLISGNHLAYVISALVIQVISVSPLILLTSLFSPRQ